MIFVGIPADSRMLGPHPFQAVGEKYIRAVVDGAGCLPVLLPSLAPPLDLRALLESLDGLLLTGAYSNIEPHHYGREASYEGNTHDPARDLNTLSLVPLAIERGLPVLASVGSTAPFIGSVKTFKYPGQMFFSNTNTIVANFDKYMVFIGFVNTGNNRSVLLSVFRCIDH